MTIHTHPEWQALLAGICAEPYDDLRRLVAADWLTESGQDERAEFIRLQCELEAVDLYTDTDQTRREAELLESRGKGWFGECEWTNNHEWFDDPSSFGDGPARWGLVRRGFVAAIATPLAWLIGGEECNDCIVVAGHRWCDTCHGTGRTPGHLDELVKVQPVTKVVVTDREPIEDGGEWMWASATDTATWQFGVHRESLTWDVAKHIKGGRHHPETRRTVAQWWFPTREPALDALSAAILNPARERAGLPALHPAEPLEVA
jgi:uncharacterized protein (TIGR02996 family)